MALTVRELTGIKPGQWLSHDGVRGAGRLMAYGTKDGGATFYFRYVVSGGRRDSLPLGPFDPRGQRGLTLAEAIDKAGDYSKRYVAGERDLRLALDAEQRERERQQAAQVRVEEQARAEAAGTLGIVLMAYVKQLEGRGKESAEKVRRSFELHVKGKWPALWDTAAKDVTMDDLLAVVRPLTEAGTLRQADKLRSYLRSAYTAAIKARQDPRASAGVAALGIIHNPAAEILSIEGANNARTRYLSRAELRAYYRRILTRPEPERSVLLFHLFTGGLRAEQMGRLTLADYNSERGTFRMECGKGRRAKPRFWDVPLIPAARHALEGMGLGRKLFSFDGGKHGATGNALQARIRPIAEAMLEANELDAGKGAFTMGDIRRTAETLLAEEGVPANVMAYLQSHDMGGVQKRHYQHAEYHKQMLAALNKFHKLATIEPATKPTKSKPAKRKQSNVVPLAPRQAKR
ncbi:hypothetical protein DVT68_15515 [Dyella solisilvae]|uniref:DUF4102 domain-containing protein n=1 Tax=Dyella solisilvae TaxID=1920168 RepID=A0A370K4W5_9GAMM|nr:hypothetical protein [Dyella solisilvae]RDI97689.1 hypothetical protein DVT68_15515 [Dyella solisilvae]